jgi:ArsR family transcriptional regulator
MSRRNPANASAPAFDAALPVDHMARICKALGHPVRLQIVQLLKTDRQCFCGQLVKRLPLAQSTVSQHLKCLKEAGLVFGENEGPGTCYYLDGALLRRFQTSLAVLLEDL